MPHRYTDEMHAWLREHYPTMTNSELAEAFADRFGEDVSAGTMKSYGNNNKLRKEPGVRERALRRYTDEQNDFLREYVPGHTEAETVAAYRERFGVTLRKSQLANRKTKLGVTSGTHGGRFQKGQAAFNKGKTWEEYMSPEGMEASRRTQFKKGDLAGAAKARLRDLLDVRVDPDGYTFIKVRPRDAPYPMRYWIPLAQFNWMQANGRDWPGDCVAVHADRDISNDEASNIVPVPRDVYVIVMGGAHGSAMPWHDRATLEVAITHAQVIRERRRLELANHTCVACGRTFTARWPNQRTCDTCLGRQEGEGKET